MKRTDRPASVALCLMTFAAFVMAAPSIPRAQHFHGADRARAELTRTDDVIARAHTVVRETMSQKGTRSLEAARGIQDRAWNSLHEDGYRLAQRLTIEARDEARHAITLARADAQTEAGVARIVEEINGRIARLSDLIATTGSRDERTLRLLNEARGLLEKSRLKARQSRYQQASRHAMDARRLVMKAEERVRNMHAIKGEHPSAKMMEAIERAGAILRDAEEAIGHGRVGDGRRLIERARETLRAAVRDGTAELTREGVEREISMVEQLREETRNLASSCPEPGIKDLLGRADDHLRLARGHIEGSDLESAWAEAVTARAMYGRISNLCAR